VVVSHAAKVVADEFGHGFGLSYCQHSELRGQGSRLSKSRGPAGIDAAALLGDDDCLHDDAVLVVLTTFLVAGRGHVHWRALAANSGLNDG
jgi:hypothetical protein